MQIVPLQLTDVIYNAATQSFDALVTVHDSTGARSYACSIDAPITMEFDDAAQGLVTQAMRRHERKDFGSSVSANHRAATAQMHHTMNHYAHAA